MTESDETLDQIAVRNFQEYLRIPSVHPNIDYEPCVKFLTRLAEDLSLPVQVVHPVAKKPVVIITWQGENPHLPSLLLNSHMDVVPVMADEWTHPPFAADIHEGKIYARGAQDMKCIGIQYLEAIRRLMQRKVRLQRTIHCTFVPDEEIGGAEGMKRFVQTEEFLRLNVGMALDEGLPSCDDRFFVYYGERCMWHVTFHCPGHPGHGSLLLEDTAAEKLHKLMTKIMAHRSEQVAILKSHPELTIGDVMTLNVTILSGGQQANVLPSELTMTMDCRIPVTMDIDEWGEKLDRWCLEAGDGVFMSQARFENAKPTNLSEENQFWMCFKKTLGEMGLQIEPRIFPGGTDARFLRELGIPALGFSPIINHPVLLHDTDEYLSVAMFQRGVAIYTDLLSKLGDAW